MQALIIDILTHPTVHAKLLSEIDTATSLGLLSPIPQYNEVLTHCPYYIACIKESMRLTPSAPNLFPRIVSTPGLSLFGSHIPPGTEISSNPYIVHRDPAIYGPDACLQQIQFRIWVWG
jgi:cytochrome P450